MENEIEKLRAAVIELSATLSEFMARSAVLDVAVQALAQRSPSKSEFARSFQSAVGDLLDLMAEHPNQRNERAMTQSMGAILEAAHEPPTQQ
ncbi:MAG: hypothetical protein ACRYF5_16680 [Janthinobacterium lividum]